jgi:L-fuculose-phosphate aldolase
MMDPSYYWRDDDLLPQDRSGLRPEPICYCAIGRVEVNGDPATTHLGTVERDSRIVLDAGLADGLSGLAAGDRVMVIFHFDRSHAGSLRQHPRGDVSRPKRGVFALRSPHRPNPIGVTVVEILQIEGSVVRVCGLDALDGTPVLDLKPASGEAN